MVRASFSHEQGIKGQEGKYAKLQQKGKGAV